MTLYKFCYYYHYYHFVFVVYKIQSDSLPCCLTPYPNGKCLSLVQNKKRIKKWTTPHSLARSLKRHSFETSLLYEAKSSVIWDEQSYGASYQGLPWTDFSLPHRKILGPINKVFDDIWPEWPWIAFFAWDFQQLQLTRYWSLSVHLSCVILSHDLWRDRI